MYFIYITSTVHKTKTEPVIININQYKLTLHSKVRFKNVITSPEITGPINTFLSAKFQPNQLNIAVTKINSIYDKSAGKAGLTKNSFHLNRDRKRKTGSKMTAKMS